MQLEMRRTCDAAPVQYEGTIDGRPFYFRARWNAWYFAVTAGCDEANGCDALPHDAFVREALWGDGPFAASAMPVEEAERIIRSCAQAYVEATQRDG